MQKLRFGHRFPQTDDFVTGLELTALFEQFDALETLQNVALYGDGAGAFEAAMLRHKIGNLRAEHRNRPPHTV